MPQYQFTVETQPQYLPDQSDPEQDIYSFAYTITITNTGDIPAQLIARHWRINDARGHTEEVRGLGVVGHQPLLKAGESFQYTSGWPGRRWGLCWPLHGRTARAGRWPRTG